MKKQKKIKMGEPTLAECRKMRDEMDAADTLPDPKRMFALQQQIARLERAEKE